MNIPSKPMHAIRNQHDDGSFDTLCGHTIKRRGPRSRVTESLDAVTCIVCNRIISGSVWRKEVTVDGWGDHLKLPVPPEFVDRMNLKRGRRMVANQYGSELWFTFESDADD